MTTDRRALLAGSILLLAMDVFLTTASSSSDAAAIRPLVAGIDAAFDHVSESSAAN